jgi:CheY-like chemotaxis protein
MALDLLRRGAGIRPCVILLDLMMPVMNGWDFYAALMEDEVLSSIPVIVLSGAADVERKAAELGVAGGIGKPISADKLLAIIKPFC